jgi:hypothetical protein
MEDTKTIHYVTQDPMAHLKLRVTLTRLSAAKSKVQQQAQVGTSSRGCCSTQHDSCFVDQPAAIYRDLLEMVLQQPVERQHQAAAVQMQQQHLEQQQAAE